MINCKTVENFHQLLNLMTCYYNLSWFSVLFRLSPIQFPIINGPFGNDTPTNMWTFSFTPPSRSQNWRDFHYPFHKHPVIIHAWEPLVVAYIFTVSLFYRFVNNSTPAFLKFFDINKTIDVCRFAIFFQHNTHS